MPNEMKNKVRPLYSEFQGYLSQAPSSKSTSVSDNALWEQYNQAVDLLSSQAEQDYKRFKIDPQGTGYEGSYIMVNTYRQKLGGLISRLHGEYFSDEAPPFSDMPSTVISQTQQQNVSVQMYLDIQSKIDESLRDTTEGSQQEGFLKKFKSLLSSVKDVNQLISLFMKEAKDFGLTIDDVGKLWGG